MDANKTPRDSSERVGSSGTDNSVSRKSIVVGEKERAEVLAAVRKGILKRTSMTRFLLGRPSNLDVNYRLGFEQPFTTSSRE